MKRYGRLNMTARHLQVGNGQTETLTLFINNYKIGLDFLLPAFI